MRERGRVGGRVKGWKGGWDCGPSPTVAPCQTGPQGRGWQALSCSVSEPHATFEPAFFSPLPAPLRSNNNKQWCCHCCFVVRKQNIAAALLQMYLGVAGRLYVV